MTQPFNTLACLFLRRYSVRCADRTLFIEHLPYQGIVRTKLPNGKILLIKSHGDDYTVNHLFWNKTYEPETFSLFFKLAQTSQWTMDVGAHVGIYSLLTAYANPQGMVHALEPLPKIHARLLENIALNKLPNIHASPLALGSHTGKTELYHADTEDIPSNSSLSKSHFELSGCPFKKILVSLMTGEQYLKEQKIPRVDLIKIDTEGTEAEVLQGMSAILRRDHPTIIGEVLEGLNNSQALENLLGGMGYRFYHLQPSGPVHSPKIIPHQLWWNYMFTTMNPREVSQLS